MNPRDGKQGRTGLTFMALCVLGISLAIAVQAQLPVPADKPSAYPSWWFERGVVKQIHDPAITTPTTYAATPGPSDYIQPDDFAAVNLGQLKAVARAGYDELVDQLPASTLSSTEGQALTTLIAGWYQNGDLNAAPVTTDTDPYAAANLGQVKHISKHFYDVLAVAGYTSGAGNPPGGWSDPAYTDPYPWSQDGSDDDNYAAANLGQLKYLFSWDLSNFNTNTDPPAAPDGLTAYEQQDGSVVLSWNDNSDNEAGFQIEVSEDGGTTWSVAASTPADTSSATVDATALTDASNAQFRISANGNNGNNTPGTGSSGSGTGTAPEPDEDWDGDGLTNDEEDVLGTDPELADTDGDTVNDLEDGWPLCDQLAPARLSKPQYAVIPLHEAATDDDFESYEINNNTHALIAVRNSTGDYSDYYFNGQTTLLLPARVDDYAGYYDLTEDNYFLRYGSIHYPNQNSAGFPAIFHEGVLQREIDTYVESIEGDSVTQADTEIDLVLPGGGARGTQIFEVENVSGYYIPVGWNSSGQVVDVVNSYDLSDGYIVGPDSVNALGVGLAWGERITSNGYDLYEGIWNAGDDSYEILATLTEETLLSPNAEDTEEYKAFPHARSINNQNTITAELGGNHAGNTKRRIWVDQDAGIRMDQPVDANLTIADLTMIDWDNAWGDTPPTNLNTQMRGFGSFTVTNEDNTTTTKRGIWQNGEWIDIESLAPATQGTTPEWSDIRIGGMNDNGTCIARATNAQGNQCAVLLLPVEIESKDRAVKGSVEIPEGWDQFSLSFRNKDTGQDLGTYENLEPGANTDVHIYNSADDFFSDAEMTQNANGTLPDNVLNQDVVFARDPDNQRKLEFSTVFDELGEIEVIVTFGSNQTQAVVTHTLEEDIEMSEFITRMDQRVSSLEVPGGEDILIDEDGDGVPDGGAASDILQAFQPGTLTTSGAPVGEYHEDDPANLTLLINNDDDNGDSQDDNSDTLVDAADNDIVKLLLKRPVNQPNDSGTLTLSVIGGSGNVRLFTADGQNELTNYSVDLANPTGDLAGLTSGNLPIYVEGLAQANDVTFIWSYTDVGGTQQVSDEVHLNVVDPSLITMMNMFAPMNGGLQYAYGNQQSVRTRSYAPNGATIWSEMALAPVGEALPIENRGMLARVFWDSGFAKLERAWISGIVDGFWVALKGEKDIVVGAWEFFRDDPWGRTAAMWGAVKEVREELKDLPVSQIPTLLGDIAKNITDDLYSQAEAALPWEPFDESLSLDVLVYMYGFTVGTVAEGVAITLTGAGIATKTATTIKGIIATAKTGRYALTALSQARKSAAKVTHMMLRMSRSKAESVRIGAIGKYLEKTDAPSGKKMAEVIDEAFKDKPNISQRYYEKLKGHWPDVTDEARLAARYQKAQHSLAKTVDLLGDDLTDNGLEGFGLTQKYLFKENVDELDRADDLIKSFGDLDTPTKRQAFNETMEQAKTTLDAGDLPNSGLKVSTKISDVHTEVYHYSDDSILGALQAQGSSWSLPGRGINNPTYVTPKKFTSASGVAGELQTTGNIRYRIDYTTSDIHDDLHIPKAKKLDANGNETGVWSHVEPVIKDNDHLGAGGNHSQLITGSGATVRVFDLVNNTYVNP